MTLFGILVILVLFVFLLDQMVERTYRYERKTSTVTPQH